MKALRKDFFMEIRRSKGRFLSIFLIVAMGVSFFSGIRSAQPDMLKTGDSYFDKLNLMDIKAVSTLGLTEDDIEAIEEVEGVKRAVGTYSVDVLCTDPESQEAYHVMAYMEDMNKAMVTEGRLPEKTGECLVDDASAYKVGDKIKLESGTDTDITDSLKTDTLEVVGTGSSPCYISFARGSTTIGTGSLTGFIVVPESTFDMDVYTEVCIEVEGAKELTAYSDEYEDLVEEVSKRIEDITDVRSTIRKQEIIDEAEEELSEAEKELADGKKEAKEELARAEKELADAKAQLEEEKARLTDGERQIADAKALLDEKQRELNAGKAEYERGLREYESGKAGYERGLREYESGRAGYESGLREYQSGVTEYERQAAAFEQEIADGRSQIASQKEQLDQARAALDAGWEQYNGLESQLAALKEQETQTQAGLEAARASKAALEQQIASLPEDTPPEELAALKEQAAALEATIQQCEAVLSEIQSGKSQLESAMTTAKTELNTQEAAYEQGAAALSQAEQELDAGEAEGRRQLSEAKNQLDAAGSQLNDAEAQLSQAAGQLDSAAAQLSQASGELDSAAAQIADGQSQIDGGYSEIAANEAVLREGREEIAKNEPELEEGQKEYEEAKKEAEEEIADGEQKIADARERIAKIEEPKWYVADRDSLPEYSGYGENADRMKAIGKVFPALFFLVAALISLTSMTRMVEEQRTQIGTFKALGYSKFDIASKYLGYALAASLGGSVFGILVGEKLFPFIIIYAYGILYRHMNDILVPYNLYYAVYATAIAVACTMAATLFSCYKELASQPAVLMRPPSPKKGKRVLVERITFIWKRLSFIWKSTIRNLFRYKKRFFMTVFGIGGCMALILVGFGLRDSIFAIADVQYEEIQTYHGMAYLQEDISGGEKEELDDYFGGQENISAYLDMYMQNVTLVNGGNKQDTYECIPKDVKEMEDFVSLHDRKTKEEYHLTDGGVIISEKTARMLEAEAGDTVEIEDTDGGNKEIKIAKICENYMGHYMYLSPAYYEKVYGEPAEFNCVYFKCNTDERSVLNETGKEILARDEVLNITYLHDVEKQLDDMLGSLNLVLVVLIVSAGLLAFIVLYNLNTINITERKRELATIKVLGFYDPEVSAYVYRENIILTAVGALAGVVMGMILHRFVIETVEVNEAMFGRVINLPSYLYSIAFTFAFSAFVNWVMYFKLKRIDMVESLKSVE